MKAGISFTFHGYISLVCYLQGRLPLLHSRELGPLLAQSNGTYQIRVWRTVLRGAKVVWTKITGGA